jgi:Ser/Thr protein kinase RdoA (MazF antagonist)
MLWLVALKRDSDLLVPEPIRTLDGELVAALGDESVPEGRCCLFRWVPGQPAIRAPSPATLALAGDATARLHEHTRRWTPPPEFVRPRWDLDWLLGPRSALGAPQDIANLDCRGRAVIAAASERVRRQVALLGEGSNGFGLLHADLNLSNIVVQDSDIGVVDFDDCGWGYYMYDLATMLCSLRHTVDNPSREAILRDAYLAGYDRVCSLPARSITLLPAFMALREMVITTFILESGNPRVQLWGPGRIAEAVDRLEAYLRDEPPSS